VNHPEVFIVPTFWFLIGYIVWVWVTTSQRKQRLKLVTEFHTRLLDKLGSVKDFGEFLQTDAGSRFMKDLAAEPVTVGPVDRIMRAAQAGVVLIFLGLGLLMVSFFWSPYAPESGQNAFGAIGAIALSLGVGFVVSAAASYRLAGALGLLNRNTESASVPAASRG
jgi:predicted phage tail protein